MLKKGKENRRKNMEKTKKERKEKVYIVIRVNNITSEPKVYTHGFFNREDAVKYIQEEWEEMFNHFLALHNMYPPGIPYFPNIDMREDHTFHEEDFAKITLEDNSEVSFYLREVNF